MGGSKIWEGRTNRQNTGYSTRQCLYACNRRLGTEPFPCSFDSRLLLKWSWSVSLKPLPFDVVIKTFCDWINALIVKRNSDRNRNFECSAVVFTWFFTKWKNDKIKISNKPNLRYQSSLTQIVCLKPKDKHLFKSLRMSHNNSDVCVSKHH